MAAICGKTCSITIDAAAYTAHTFSVNKSSNEVDVTSFGSGTYGDWLACTPNATVSAQFYDIPAVEINDEVAVVLTFGYTAPVTWTVDGVVSGVTADVDAKGVANHTLTVRLIGDIVVS